MSGKTTKAEREGPPGKPQIPTDTTQFQEIGEMLGVGEKPKDTVSLDAIITYLRGGDMTDPAWVWQGLTDMGVAP